MPSFKVKVVTHAKKVIDQEADYVRVKTTEGELGILANHAPLVAELAMGAMEIEYQDKAKRDAYFVSGGFLEISNNEVTIIADEIEAFNDVNIEIEEAEIRKLNQLLLEEKENKEVLEKRLQEKQKKVELKKIFTK